MSWQVEVDARTCIGSGMCAALAPDRFKLDGEHATALTKDVEPDETLLDVADSCPAMAITVTDGGNEIGPRP
jgi:ferredoxin